MLDDKSKKSLSALRLANAKEQLGFIPGILALGDYKTVVNRSYYSVFYAMRAVLALDEYDSKKHSGIISEFRKRYIKTGIFSDDLSDIIGELFMVRSNGDYDDFYIVSREKAEMQYHNAKLFIEEIEKYLLSL